MSSDTVTLIGYLLGAIPACTLSAAAVITARRTHAEVKTNNGKSAWEYLEMIADVKGMVADVRIEQAEVRTDLLAHTAEDAKNFGLLHKAMLGG